MSSSKLSSRASSRSARWRGARPALLTSALQRAVLRAQRVDQPRPIGLARRDPPPRSATVAARRAELVERRRDVGFGARPAERRGSSRRAPARARCRDRCRACHLSRARSRGRHCARAVTAAAFVQRRSEERQIRRLFGETLDVERRLPARDSRPTGSTRRAACSRPAARSPTGSASDTPSAAAAPGGAGRC